MEHSNVEDEWADMINQLQGSILDVPTVFTAGNHDTAPEKYIEHLNVPVTNNADENGTYYSFDYNGAHFAVLNTNDNPDGGSVSATQLAWLDADLAAARANDANWLIVAYHKPFSLLQTIHYKIMMSKHRVKN